MVGCGGAHLSVRQRSIDASYLASTFVGSPDPRQEDPPHGQMLVIDWRVDDEMLCQRPRVVLEVIMRNYEQRLIEQEIDDTAGYFTYSVLNRDFEQTKGILTYRASLVMKDGTVLKTWKQQLWVDLLEFDQE